MIEVREHPILFSGEMVRAILDGRKTQTRRVVVTRTSKPRGVRPEHMEPWLIDDEWQEDDDGRKLWIGTHPSFPYADGKWFSCDYGAPGDRLWVKEAAYIAPPNFSENTYNVKDDQGRNRCVGWAASMDAEDVRCATDYGVKKSPSIHMPRWASRLTLEVVSVRVERVNAISEDDACAEGVTLPNGEPSIVNDAELGRVVKYGHYQQFAALWDKINAKRDEGKYAWERNPWVWVIEFKRVSDGA